MEQPRSISRGYRAIRDRHAYIVLGFLFLVQIIVISPLGEFALNDDWVHTVTIYNFLKFGVLSYPDWISPNSHILMAYGAVLGTVFGFSFSLFRISTIVFSWGIIILMYRLLRKCDVPVVSSLLLALLIWANPIFMNLSYTFMSDIPSLFFLVASLYWYFLGFKESKVTYLTLGSALSVLGFFIRQTNIVLFVSAGAYYLLRKRPFHLRQFLLAFVLPGIILVMFYSILFMLHALPTTVGARFLYQGLSYAQHIITNGWDFLLLFSLFLTPVSISILAKNLSWLRTRQCWVLTGLGAVVLIYAAVNHAFFPSMGNIINITGLGPASSVMQGDIAIDSLTVWPFILTAALTFNLVLMALVMLNARNNLQDTRFVSYFFVLYMVILLPIFSFDRYLLAVLPVVALYCGSVLRTVKWSPTAFVVMLIVLASCSAIGTYDYLSWNRVRWDLGNVLLSRGVAVSDIEGGYEWNGWHLYGKGILLGSETPTWAPWYVKELTPGHQMKYILSFSPLGGYEVLEKRKVSTLFSPIQYIYLNKVAPHTAP